MIKTHPKVLARIQELEHEQAQREITSLVFGQYAHDISAGNLYSFALRCDSTSSLGKPPAFPTRSYSVKVKPGGPDLAIIHIRSIRMLFPHELVDTDTAQFPDLPTLKAFARNKPIFLLRFHMEDLNGADAP